MSDDAATNEGEVNESTDGATDGADKGTDTKAASDAPKGEASKDEGNKRSGKPEWMSNKAWDDKFSKVEGDLNMEDVAKHFQESHKNAEEALHNRKDVIKGEIEQELAAKAKEGVPESSNDYVFEQSTLAEELGLEIDYDNVDDPHLIQFKTWAHKNNLSQKEFNNVMEMHMSALTQIYPNWDNEMKLLGDNAEARVGHLNAWMGKVLSPDSYRAMESIAISADKIIALEELQELSGIVSFTNDGNASGEGMTRADITKLMDSEEYRKGDPATLQKVQAGFARLTKGRKSA